MANDDAPIHVCDYAVAFVDVLGQSEAMLDQRLTYDRDAAIAVVKNSVGKVVTLQNLFKTFLEEFEAGPTVYDLFSLEDQRSVPDMARGTLKWQRFSDGFIVYAALGDGITKAPAKCIFGLLMAAGVHCLIGLAGRSPIRIGIDVDWAVEYRPDELYGASVARACHLEGKVAQWPRVVVGDRLHDYLKHYIESATDNVSSQIRSRVAELCLSLIRSDADGQRIVDYLGTAFREATRGAVNAEVVGKARKYVAEQLALAAGSGNTKLLGRYQQVERYFSTAPN